jgi:hypothetical protein
MATSSIKLSMSSDITTSNVALAATFKLTTDGSTGLDLSSGLARKKIDSGADTTIIAASDYTATGENQLAFVFIKNLSSTPSSPTFTDALAIKLDSDGDSTADATLGYLAGGQAIILPYSADSDIMVRTDVDDTVVEYIILHVE